MYRSISTQHLKTGIGLRFCFLTFPLYVAYELSFLSCFFSSISIQGLIPNKQYKFVIVSENGVSQQAGTERSAAIVVTTEAASTYFKFEFSTFFSRRNHNFPMVISIISYQNFHLKKFLVIRIVCNKYTMNS